MHLIRQLLQLHLQGLSIRQLPTRLSMARNTVRHYLRTLQGSGTPLNELLDWEDGRLDALLVSTSPLTESPRHTQLWELMPAIHQQVLAGVTLYQLWLEYRQQHPDGYQYTQFGVIYRKWRKPLEASLHLDHQAGDKLFVDFAGTKLHLTNPMTGEQTPVEVFVAILGHSQLTYVQAVASQKSADFLSALEGTFRFLGGVPAAIVPDNLKTAVRRAHRYDPELNPTLADFALHFDTCILPARAGKPKDKPLVEGAVRILYQRVYARLRNHTFSSLAELNQAIGEQVSIHNQTRFQRQAYSRRDVFDDYECNTLKPLPTHGFILKYYRWATVQKNYHVLLSDDKRYYSVPYRLIGQRVQLVISAQTLEIYHNHQRVAVHDRQPQAGSYVTSRHHQPPAHRHVQEWTPDYFRQQAQQIGPHTLAVVEHLLASRQHPEQAHRWCLGLIRQEKKVGPERLERACERALFFNSVSYSVIDNILRRGLDAMPVNHKPADTSIVHENIRGAAAYQ